MTAFSLPRETSLHRNRDASLLSAIPSLRSLRISFPAPSSKLDIFAKRQVVTCLFCLPVGFSSFPKSSAILFGSVADDLLFGSFFTSLIILCLFLLTGQNIFSSLHDTSIRQNQKFFYSINNSCQRQPLFPLSLRFFVCCADSPKKRCLLGNPVYRCTLRMPEQAPLSFLLLRQIKRFPPAARRI